MNRITPDGKLTPLHPGWRKLWWLGFVGFLPLLIRGGGALHLFLLCFLAPLVVDLVGWLHRRPLREDTASGAPPIELPLPGPAERSGAALFLLRYQLSSLLMVLNPFQFVQLLRQLRGEASARRRVGEGAEGAGHYTAAAEYRLPFAGEWYVMNGGTTPESSHSWDLLSQRYAYDFVIADPTGSRHRDDGTKREHYFCYGEPVLAAADGVVVRVRDEVRDAPRVGTGWVDWRCRDFGGNSVTLQHAGSEYSYSAHLVPGSITVRPGDEVRRGQRIGSCGHSGHSTEPHLHFQIQDHPDFFRAAGLPVAFTGCRVDGERAPGPVYLQAGMRVRSDTPGDGVTGQAP